MIKAKKGEHIERGRPRTYDPSMCQTILEVAAQGGHIPAMCLAIGIRSPDTWYRWKEEYPEFREAADYAKLISQAFYETLLLKAGTGQLPGCNFNSIAMVMNNKFSDEYKRSANSASTEINIGSINSIERLDENTLDKKIAAMNKKLSVLIPQGTEDNESDS